MNRLILIALACANLLLIGCVEVDTTIPKPSGYFRIDFPEKQYVLYEEECPFSFEVPTYAILENNSNFGEGCYKNLYYPQLKATVYFTYLEIDSNFTEIAKYAEDKVYEHRVMASGIEPSIIDNPEEKVYGFGYSLMGDVAVNYLFYVTDSSKHYFAGQLYFEAVPNYDSLQPCIDFIEQDMEHLITTFKWI